MAAAADRAERPRQGADQHAAAAGGRAHHHDHAAARGRGLLGDARRDVRDARGNVRRNKLSDFVQVNRNGKIAMKLDEGDAIVDVQICSEGDDVLLTTAEGPVHPLPGARGARLQGPRLDRRARHQPRQGRPRHLDGDPAPRRGHAPRSAPPISRRQRDRGRRRPRGSDGRGGAIDAEESGGGAVELGEQIRRDGGGPSSSSSRCPRRATASAPRPSSTGSRGAAAKASSPWR